MKRNPGNPCRISKIDSNQEKFLSDLTGIHQSNLRKKSAYEIKSRVTSQSQAFVISFFFAAAPLNHSGISYLYGYGISIFEPNAYETS